ncbi:uncharacterized protein LOC129304159 [Prosopis cineraria]|uniref:uncharacterized protein LOC129304159 n=1 Tax=Prosopis cineraria TaxID=364024 RepID=UPI00240EB595|nr:uncharacterized protein LOC129304159 [Prosopis cineraria]
MGSEEFANCSYRIYEPSCKRIEDEGEVTFSIDVKGYTKSQLHVKPVKGKLLIWGERHVGEMSLRKIIKLERRLKNSQIRATMATNDSLEIIIKKPARKGPVCLR